MQPELGLVNPIPPQSFLLSRPKNFRISCNEFPSGTWFQAADPSPLVIESGQKIFVLSYIGVPASALIRSFSQRGRNRAVATTFFVKSVILVKLAITVVVSLSYPSLRKG